MSAEAYIVKGDRRWKFELAGTIAGWFGALLAPTPFDMLSVFFMAWCAPLVFMWPVMFRPGWVKMAAEHRARWDALDRERDRIIEDAMAAGISRADLVAEMRRIGMDVDDQGRRLS